jgi:hypothetical protein
MRQGWFVDFMREALTNILKLRRAVADADWIRIMEEADVRNSEEMFGRLPLMAGTSATSRKREVNEIRQSAPLATHTGNRLHRPQPVTWEEYERLPRIVLTSTTHSP